MWKAKQDWVRRSQWHRDESVKDANVKSMKAYEDGDWEDVIEPSGGGDWEVWEAAVNPGVSHWGG